MSMKIMKKDYSKRKINKKIDKLIQKMNKNDYFYLFIKLINKDII